MLSRSAGLGSVLRDAISKGFVHLGQSGEAHLTAASRHAGGVAMTFAERVKRARRMVDLMETILTVVIGVAIS